MLQPNRANPIQNARLDSVRWTASKIETKRSPRVTVKSPLSQRSLDSLNAAKLIPKTKTRITSVPMLKRKRFMAYLVVVEGDTGT